MQGRSATSGSENGHFFLSKPEGPRSRPRPQGHKHIEKRRGTFLTGGWTGGRISLAAGLTLAGGSGRRLNRLVSVLNVWIIAGGKFHLPRADSASGRSWTPSCRRPDFVLINQQTAPSLSRDIGMTVT